MRTLRFYSPALAVGRIVLDPVESHHLIHVLRLKIGSEIELFDGRGNRASAVVAEIRKKEALVDVREVRCCAPLKPALILGVSIARGSRFDLVVEKCTELGADHIAAVQFDRTVKLGKGESLERYRRIAVSAVKQCGRDRLPILSGPAPLDRTIGDLEQLYPDALRLYGHPGPDAAAIAQLSPDIDQPILCMVGPEGGYTEQELSLLADRGFRPVRIGPHVLRTETAAMAFAALFGACKQTDLP